MTDQNLPPVPPTEPSQSDAAAGSNAADAVAAAPAFESPAAPEFSAPEVPAAPEAPAYGAPAAPAAPAYGAPAAPNYAAPATPYGAPAAYNQAGLTAPKTNTFAIVSLVASIAGWFTGITFIVGVIFGHLSLSQIKKTGEQGRGMAVAGLIVGYIGIALGLLAVIFFVVLIAAVGTTSYDY